mmetsp:Transcript_75111/g.229815  ORF Transcript_75111/g.229815 Transcript_75111/m.229815 type:complete len:256 (-) Transcript_75111:386-1153(-)
MAAGSAGAPRDHDPARAHPPGVQVRVVCQGVLVRHIFGRRCAGGPLREAHGRPGVHGAGPRPREGAAARGRAAGREGRRPADAPGSAERRAGGQHVALQGGARRPGGAHRGRARPHRRGGRRRLRRRQQPLRLRHLRHAAPGRDGARLALQRKPQPVAGVLPARAERDLVAGVGFGAATVGAHGLARNRCDRRAVPLLHAALRADHQRRVHHQGRALAARLGRPGADHRLKIDADVLADHLAHDLSAALPLEVGA